MRAPSASTVAVLFGLTLLGACAARDTAQAPASDPTPTETSPAAEPAIDEPATPEEAHATDAPATLVLSTVGHETTHYQIAIEVLAHETLDPAEVSLGIDAPSQAAVESDCALPLLQAEATYVCTASVGPVHGAGTLTVALRWTAGDAVVASLSRSVRLGEDDVAAGAPDVAPHETGLGPAELYLVPSEDP